LPRSYNGTSRFRAFRLPLNCAQHTRNERCPEQPDFILRHHFGFLMFSRSVFGSEPAVRVGVRFQAVAECHRTISENRLPPGRLYAMNVSSDRTAALSRPDSFRVNVARKHLSKAVKAGDLFKHDLFAENIMRWLELRPTRHSCVCRPLTTSRLKDAVATTMRPSFYRTPDENAPCDSLCRRVLNYRIRRAWYPRRMTSRVDAFSRPGPGSGR